MQQKISFQSWLYLLILSLIWGSSFILMKKGLVAFSATQVASMRIFFSALTVLPFVFVSFKQLTKKDVLPVLLVGLTGSGIPPFLYTIAQTKIDSAAAGILNSLTPIFTLLIGVLFFQMLFHWKKLIGVGLGFLGGVSLIFPNLETVGTQQNVYGLLIVFATICYAISVNTIKTRCVHISPIYLNTMVFSFLGPWAAIYLFSTDFIFLLQTSEEAWTALGYIVILAVLGTSFSSVLFFKLTQETNALFASTVTYLIPIVAIIWGFLDGEVIGWNYLVGIVFILVGVYLTSRKNKLSSAKLNAEF